MHCMILGMNYSLRIGITDDSGNQCSHAVSIGNNRESLRRNGRTGDCRRLPRIHPQCDHLLELSVSRSEEHRIRKCGEAGVPVWKECTSAWAGINPLRNVSSQRKFGLGRIMPA